MNRTLIRISAVIAMATLNACAVAAVCPTFAAGDLNYISKLNQVSAGCTPTSAPDYSLLKADAGGSVDAITATFSPAITLTDKVTVGVIVAGANATTTPTFAPNGLTARTIVARGGAALVAGDIGPAGFVALLEYNAAGTRWELMNPLRTPIGDVTGLAAGVATFLVTPSSANLRSALTDETGIGAAVFANTPTLVTPDIGAATGTSLNVSGTIQGVGITSTSTIVGQNQITGNTVISAGQSMSIGTANVTPGTLLIKNASTGSTTLQTSIAGSSTNTISLPATATSDTLVGRASTDTLTNKSIDAGQLTGTIAAARMPALTGDVTTSAGAVATTLATVNSNVGTFGSATQAPSVTVNAKGLVTAASNVTVTPAVGSITGFGTGVATWLATPSSANLASALTDETGSGVAVFATNPTFAGITMTGAMTGSLPVTGIVTARDNVSYGGSFLQGSSGTAYFGAGGTDVLALYASGASRLTVTGAAVAIPGTLNGMTVPSVTDTVVGKATTDAFTNKTYNTAATGNVFQINSNTISAYSGTGSTVMLTASPTTTGTLTGAAANFSGNVNVGTTTPASSSGIAFATVKGWQSLNAAGSGGFAILPNTGATGAVIYRFSGVQGSESYSEALRFDATGVGIGTAPSSKLEVWGTAPVVKITQDPGVAGNVALTMAAAGASNTAIINLGGAVLQNSTAASTTLVLNPTSGGVAVGATSSTSPIGFGTTAYVKGASSASVVVDGGGIYRSEFGTSVSGTYFGSIDSIPVRFVAGATEAARFDTAGAFGIGLGSGTLNTRFQTRGAHVANYGVVYLEDSTAQAAGTGAGISLGGKFNDGGSYTPGVMIRASKTNSTTANYSFDTLFQNYRSGDANMTTNLVVTADGRLYGSALHNNAGAVTGATNQYIASGTYTPTITNLANVAASASNAIQWMRVGNVVTVGGEISIDATAVATTSFSLTLPIATDINATGQIGGSGTSANTTPVPVSISGDATTNLATFSYVPLTDPGYVALTFSFMYVVR